MENVAGMVKGKMRLIFREILSELKDAGYQVSARLMDSKYFLVPQARQRLIFLGAREDLGIKPSHPVAQYSPITVAQAFENITDFEAPELPDWLKAAAEDMVPGNFNSRYTVEAFAKHRNGKTGGARSTLLLSWDRWAPTVVKTEFSHCGIIHPNKQRKLSVQELKRISSFPDQFQFAGTRSDALMRMGNTVPPLFMSAIARHIRESILKN